MYGQQTAKLLFTTLIQPPYVVIWTAAQYCHLRLHRVLCPSSAIHLLLGDTAAGLSSNPLEPVCFVSGCLTQHTAGVASWPGGKSSSRAVAALALIIYQLITAHHGVVLTEGPRPPSEAHCLTVWRWRYMAIEDVIHWWTIKETYRSKTVFWMSSMGCWGNNGF